MRALAEVGRGVGAAIAGFAALWGLGFLLDELGLFLPTASLRDESVVSYVGNGLLALLPLTGLVLVAYVARIGLLALRRRGR